jgi:hypothetical protein
MFVQMQCETLQLIKCVNSRAQNIDQICGNIIIVILQIS